MGGGGMLRWPFLCRSAARIDLAHLRGPRTNSFDAVPWPWRVHTIVVTIIL